MLKSYLFSFPEGLEISVRINLPLISTVLPSDSRFFLSCRPLVVITTFSTGLVGETEVTSTPTRLVENFMTTKGLEDKNIHLLGGTPVENKGKTIN